MVLFSCKEKIEIKEINATVDEIVDPLPSWNEVTQTSHIIDYVEDITNVESTNFIPIPDRIAIFDNDGNLWSEQPAYFQLFFAIDRVNALAESILNGKPHSPLRLFWKRT